MSASQFFSWFDKVSADFRASDIGKAFAAESMEWEPYHTGGGCLAVYFGRPTYYHLMTNDDLGFPDAESPVNFGHYNNDDNELCVAFGEYSTLPEAFAAARLCDAWRASGSTLGLKEWADNQPDLPADQRDAFGKLQFDIE